MDETEGSRRKPVPLPYDPTQENLRTEEAIVEGGSIPWGQEEQHHRAMFDPEQDTHFIHAKPESGAQAAVPEGREVQPLPRTKPHGKTQDLRTQSFPGLPGDVPAPPTPLGQEPEFGVSPEQLANAPTAPKLERKRKARGAVGDIGGVGEDREALLRSFINADSETFQKQAAQRRQQSRKGQVLNTDLRRATDEFTLARPIERQGMGTGERRAPATEADLGPSGPLPLRRKTRLPDPVGTGDFRRKDRPLSLSLTRQPENKPRTKRVGFAGGVGGTDPGQRETLMRRTRRLGARR